MQTIGSADADGDSSDFENELADLENGNFEFGGVEAADSKSFHVRFYRYMEQTTLWVKTRWLIFAVLFLSFGARIIIRQGFYIVAYAYGIYFLNLVLGFLSPQADPEMRDIHDRESESDHGEFRPFVRRLPEFKFWFYATQWLCISLVLTAFDIFDLPVFWPILVMYFIVLTCLTMKERIKHMIRYRYVPFDLTGKKKQYNKPAQKEGGDEWD